MISGLGCYANRQKGSLTWTGCVRKAFPAGVSSEGRVWLRQQSATGIVQEKTASHTETHDRKNMVSSVNHKQYSMSDP